MGKNKIKSIKISLRFIGDQLDFGSNPENNFLKSAKLWSIYKKHGRSHLQNRFSCFFYWVSITLSNHFISENAQKTVKLNIFCVKYIEFFCAESIYHTFWSVIVKRTMDTRYDFFTSSCGSIDIVHTILEWRFMNFCINISDDRKDILSYQI